MDIEKVYKKFIEDDTIKSLTELSKQFDDINPKGTNSRAYRKMCNMLYKEYGKEHVKSIANSRFARYRANKQWETRSRKMPEDVKQKISKATKKAWEGDVERRELGKKLIAENCYPVSSEKWVRDKAIKTRRKRDKWAEYSDEGYESLVSSSRNREVSDETREKMSKSAKARGNNLPDGFRHSDETKNLLSELAKKQWENGMVNSYQSKPCIELINMLKEFGFDVYDEYFLEGRPFDIKINNLLVEFNGTYWHYDPDIYEYDYYDKSRKCYVGEVWMNDCEKIDIGLRNGYDVIVVWESEWNDDKDKVLNNINKKINE